MITKYSTKINKNGNSFKMLVDTETKRVKTGYNIFIGSGDIITTKKVINNICTNLLLSDYNSNKKIYHLFYNYGKPNYFELYDKIETDNINNFMGEFAVIQGDDYLYDEDNLTVYDKFGNIFKFIIQK